MFEVSAFTRLPSMVDHLTGKTIVWNGCITLLIQAWMSAPLVKYP